MLSEGIASGIVGCFALVLRLLSFTLVRGSTLLLATDRLWCVSRLRGRGLPLPLSPISPSRSMGFGVSATSCLVVENQDIPGGQSVPQPV